MRRVLGAVCDAAMTASLTMARRRGGGRAPCRSGGRRGRPPRSTSPGRSTYSPGDRQVAELLDDQAGERRIVVGAPCPRRRAAARRSSTGRLPSRSHEPSSRCTAPVARPRRPPGSSPAMPVRMSVGVTRPSRLAVFVDDQRDVHAGGAEELDHPQRRDAVADVERLARHAARRSPPPASSSSSTSLDVDDSRRPSSMSPSQSGKRERPAARTMSSTASSGSSGVDPDQRVARHHDRRAAAGRRSG